LLKLMFEQLAAAITFLPPFIIYKGNNFLHYL